MLYQTAIEQYRERLLDEVLISLPSAAIPRIEAAADFAIVAHDGQQRLSGLPYVTHALETGRKLAAMHLPENVVIAGILHDVYEDTNTPLDIITQRFGADVGRLVAGVTKVGKVQLRGEQRYIENLRKMFVAIASDVRVMFIKFADRMHNLEDLEVVPQPKRQRIALEALEIYAPIANRLGMMEIKGQLEDLSFRHVYPEEAQWVDSLIATTYDEKRSACAALRAEVDRALTAQSVHAIGVQGRLKQRYSLYRKLLKHERDITNIYDIIALRIIVESVGDCYTVLGYLHQRWKPMPGRIKDYIANPKPNGYQSIHTTMMTDSDDVVEFQIRTEAMHEEAEWGAAAAWRYHEHGNLHTSVKQLRWVNELVQWQRSIKDPQEFIAGLKTEVLRDRILIFTPKGDVIDLPEGATPLDVAYAIHSDLGNHAIGARVNGQSKLHPLDAPLTSGDLVEVLTDPRRKGPSPDWLHIVKSVHARAKIKEALRNEARHAAYTFARRT